MKDKSKYFCSNRCAEDIHPWYFRTHRPEWEERINGRLCENTKWYFFSAFIITLTVNGKRKKKEESFNTIVRLGRLGVSTTSLCYIFDKTDAQWMSLRITWVEIIKHSVYLTKPYFKRLIWQSLAIRDDTVRLESITTLSLNLSIN